MRLSSFTGSELPASQQRRNDLDWIRVGAFFLLILYHVGMVYVPWDFHIKSPRTFEILEPVMMITNPWRLTLLFLVSGAATRMLVDKFAGDGGGVGLRLSGSRALRLAPVLLFGMFVIVPPQSYFEVVQALQWMGITDPGRSPALQDFWIKYATASGGWCDVDGCLTTPTWNHLWFVAYLLVYGLILALLNGLLGRATPVAERILERTLHGWGMLVWPVLFLAAVRLTLAPVFPVTHALVDDWYNHALSFSAYLFGFLIVRSEPIRGQLIKLRHVSMGLAIAAWAAWAAYAWFYREATPSQELRQIMGTIYAIDQWAWIAAILGYGARHFDHGGPVLRYLSRGVFPFYIVHQTAIVVIAWQLMPLQWPIWVEVGAVVGLTLATCFVSYEVARRIGPLGLLLGVQNQRHGGKAGRRASVTAGAREGSTS